MIDLKELRIGNWVNCHFLTTNFNAQVLQMTPGMVVVQDGEHKNSYGFENISPIHLTPEILKNCGFEKLQDDGSFGMEKQVKIKATHIILSEGDRNGFCEVFICGMDDVRVQHLHQLQNLFYALTQTELEVKL